MNPLTLVKRIQNINKREATLGISEDASWHAKYKDSAYVYVGGIPFDLTEGDLLAVFAQYGEIVDVNLVRDKGTGKSKGFAFIAYEDQRSTNLAVDNLNGAQILGRIVRVDHVSKYKKFEEEDEETRQQKREERGVCRAFQKGECSRGDSCKFSHDEHRAANTGWGADDDRRSKGGHDKFESSIQDGRSSQASGSTSRGGEHRSNRDPARSRPKGHDTDRERSYKGIGTNDIDLERRHVEEQRENVTKHKSERRSLDTDKRPREEHYDRNDKALKKYEPELYDRNGKRPNKYDSESNHREEHIGTDRDGRSVRDRYVTHNQRRRGAEQLKSHR